MDEDEKKQIEIYAANENLQAAKMRLLDAHINALS